MLLKSPLVHFFLIASLVFAAQLWQQKNNAEKAVVAVSLPELEALYIQSSHKGTAPKPLLRASLSYFVDQTLLYHEGLRLGLIQNDIVIINRLLKNMNFIAPGQAENPEGVNIENEAEIADSGMKHIEQALEMGMLDNDPVIRRRVIQMAEQFIKNQHVMTKPTEEQLQTYIEEHAEQYQLSPHLNMQQVFFTETNDRDAEQWATLTKQLQNNDGAINTLGESSILPRQLKHADKRNIARYFGQDFAEQVAALSIDKWQGPIKSDYGNHLVKISDKQAGGLPPIKQVQSRVLIEWQHSQREDYYQSYLETLRQQYSVQADGHAQVPATEFADYWLEQWL